MPPQLKLDVSAEVAAAQKALAPAVKRLNTILARLSTDKLPSVPTGAVADALYDMKQLSRVLGTLLAPFDDLLLPSVKNTEEYLIGSLAVGESSGVQGMKARVQITERMIPVVDTQNDGWKKFYAHIKKTGEFDLLNKALNAKAVQERWDNKKNVPGVGKFNAKKVSCTKLGGKA